MDFEHMQASLRIDNLVKMVEKMGSDNDDAPAQLNDYIINELKEIKAVLES